MKLEKLTQELFDKHAHELPGSNIMGFAIPYVTQTGEAWAAFDDGGKLVGMGGIFDLWDGVGEAWTVLSNKCKKAFFLHRTAKKTIESLIQKRKYHRVQMNVDVDNESAQRWALKLGFAYEGMMHAFTSEKKDHIRYARVIWPQL